MSRQNCETARSVVPDTLPPLATTAEFHAAASGWTRVASGRSNLAFIGMAMALEEVMWCYWGRISLLFGPSQTELTAAISTLVPAREPPVSMIDIVYGPADV